MMATAESFLIRAYLDWQAEMGSDEVVLPQPLAKRASAFTATPAASSAGAPADAGRHDGGGSMASHPGLAPGGKPLLGYPSTPSPTQGSGAITGADLYASLTQALNKSPDSRTGETVTGGSGRASGRGPEALALPAFSDLAAFWDHLERTPGLVLGDPAGGSLQAPAPLDGANGTKGEGSDKGVLRMIRSSGPVKAPLALVGFEPGEEDASEGRPFQGEPGALLEKMMRAIRLDVRELYQTLLIKVRLAGKAWSRREMIRVLPLLHAELGLAQAPMVLLLGQECAQAVLKTGKTLDELRQETHRMEGREFFVTYHPSELLRKEELKRKAWEDLQWLQRRMAEAQARP